MVLGTGTFSTRGPQTEEEILAAQRSGTTFGSAGPVRDPRLTKNEQGPRTIEQIQEDASAVFFGMGREIAKIVKEPNGPLMTREGSALRQQFDNAANTYARTLVAGGMDEESAIRTVGIKKRLIEAKIPPILPQKGTLKPGEVPTSRDPISGDVTPAGTAAPFKPQVVGAGGALIGEEGIIGEAPPKPRKALTPKQVQDNETRLSAFDTGIEDIDRILTLAEAPGAQLGGFAGVKKSVRDFFRLGEDVAVGGGEELRAAFSGIASVADSLITEEVRTGTLDPDVAQLLQNTPLSEISGIEGRLAFLVARSLQPEGRLLKDAVKTAQKQVNVFSLFKGEESVAESLKEIRRGMVVARNRLRQATGKPPIPVERTQSVTGGSLPGTAEELSQLSDDEVLRRLGIR